LPFDHVLAMANGIQNPREANAESVLIDTE
jgi:hypothetical protein